MEEKKALHESYASALQGLVAKARSDSSGPFSDRRGVGEAVELFLSAHKEEVTAHTQLARETGTQANALASLVADKRVRKLCSEAQAVHKKLDGELAKLSKAKATRDAAAQQAAEADRALTYFGKYGQLPPPEAGSSSASSSLGKMLGGLGGALSQQPTAESLAAQASAASHKLEVAEREYVAKVESARYDERSLMLWSFLCPFTHRTHAQRLPRCVRQRAAGGVG